MTCIAECWTAVRCPGCGQQLPPRGRSVPAEMAGADCCHENQHSEINKRHLWNEHDSDMHYFDPDGWKHHVATCEICNESA